MVKLNICSLNLNFQLFQILILQIDDDCGELIKGYMFTNLYGAPY